ncbi:hypothetical protein ATANTOWER_014195 [Ataeniobius toweri]|uniref:Uncharacterized protein n=1 Tax=Ataeniobius toweri TaxID=208326 RepID=A0ABU7CGM0_9TELE|nr:hypothetical protein [Ataeniobius toweri]
MSVWLWAGEEDAELVSDLNLLKNVFSSLTLSKHPSILILLLLEAVIFFISDQTSLILFYWSLLSSVCSLPLMLSCFCILLTNSLFPSLKALFISCLAVLSGPW